MKLRSKIILIVVPLLALSLALTAFAASLSARHGITRIANQLLLFKLEALSSQAESQWRILVDNDLDRSQQFVAVAQAAVRSFAVSLLRSDSEIIFAVDGDGQLVMSTAAVELTAEQAGLLGGLARGQYAGWTTFTVAGRERVAQTSHFAPFGWLLVVSEEREAFYQPVTEIFTQSATILLAVILVAVGAAFLIARMLTAPLEQVVATMEQVIGSNDLSLRVPVVYGDETGRLAHTFNSMTGGLEEAYEQVKAYALNALMAQRQEQRIRNIFQKYVPREVIDELFAHPETLLRAQERSLAIVVCDVRSFSTIVANLQPEQLIELLNGYFARMGDIVAAEGGVVDKYLGDAVMAMFGAPVAHENDPQRAVSAALAMLDALSELNATQRERGWPALDLGIGVNYGPVTVGNIGSERKMDYTVIGDMVNLTFHLQDLTKSYQSQLVISEAVRAGIEDDIPTRLLDRITLRSSERPVGIYTARRQLGDDERLAWETHEEAVQRYYTREFEQAEALFQQVRELLPGDTVAAMFAARCKLHRLSPPADDWDGVVAVDVR